nr:Lipid-binding serum glycoprotein domain containing protein [Haemonchus contortus]
MVGPGVRLRLTPVGAAYVTSMVARMLVPEVATARMPFEAKSVTFPSLPTAGLASMQLRLFDIPEAFDISTAPPNLVIVGLQNSTISVTATGTGHVDDVPLNGPLEIRVNRFQMEVGVEVKKNTRGNPGLKVVFCEVPTNIPVTVAVQNPLTPETGAKFASRANSLILDYTMLDGPFMSARGIELSTSGEISTPGQRTPFGPRPLALPTTVSPSLLQLVVSDYVPNSLMYHGHLIGLFNTRIDSMTPQLGPVMRTTCDMSTGSLFCVGDLFPTLRDLFPNRDVAFSFSTIKAPAFIVRQPERGGIRFRMLGLIDVAVLGPNGDSPVGAMEIHIDASMKMKMSSKSVRGKVNLETIRLVTRSPRTLVQDELDDAGFLSREILQRMVNDILKQGIPIPVHPLFKLQKPKLSLAERSMVLETDFKLNRNLIRQLIGEKLA